MTWYVYILMCRDRRRYVGSTADLHRRLHAHNAGYVRSTRMRRPVRVVYYEIFGVRAEAVRREQQLKNGKTRKTIIERLISVFDQAKCQGFNSRIRLTSLSLRKSCAH